MIHGEDKVKNKMREIENLGNAASVKEKGMYSTLEIVMEMYERGIKFLPIDLYKSHNSKFLMEEDGIRPPLDSIPGLGPIDAENIFNARADGKFSSIEDLKIRSKIGKVAIETLKGVGLLDGMTESNQMSLFA